MPKIEEIKPVVGCQPTQPGQAVSITLHGSLNRGITLAAFDLEKMVFVSTSAWIDMGVDVSRSVVYASQGFINAHVLTYLPAMSVASITGSWLGKRALERISQSSFRSIVLGLVVLMGVITLWQAWSV